MEKTTFSAVEHNFGSFWPEDNRRVEHTQLYTQMYFSGWKIQNICFSIGHLAVTSDGHWSSVHQVFQHERLMLFSRSSRVIKSPKKMF